VVIVKEEQKTLKRKKLKVEAVGRVLLVVLTDPKAHGRRKSQVLASVQLFLPEGPLGTLLLDAKDVPVLGSAYKVKISLQPIGYAEAMKWLGWKQFQPPLNKKESWVV